MTTTTFSEREASFLQNLRECFAGFTHRKFSKVVLSLFIVMLFTVSTFSEAQNTSVAAAENHSANFSFSQFKSNEINAIGAVNRVIRDHKGFMWFGGQDGLARFDGNVISIHKNLHGDVSTLDNNYVNDIVEDSFGNLWVATRGGVNRYLRDSNTFVRYPIVSDEADGATPQAVITMMTHSSGTLWLGTNGSGLKYYDRESDTFRAFETDAQRSLGLSSHTVQALAEDSMGNLWIGTEKGGLNYLDLSSRRFRHFKNKPSDINSLSDDNVRAVVVDNQDNLWIGTFGGGLNFYDMSKRRFVRFESGVKSSDGISSPYVRDLHIDKDAFLWIATENGGLNKYDLKSQQFFHYGLDVGNPVSLGSNSPVSLYEDVVGDLWIGLSPAGINTLDKHLPRFGRYRHNALNSNSLSHNEVTAVVEDGKNNLWVGTLDGLNYVDRKTHQVTRYKHDRRQPGSLSSSRILSLLEDRQGRLWVGTQGQGVNRLSAGSAQFTAFAVDQGPGRGVSGRNIQSIFQDSQGSFWFGSATGGLTRYDEGSGQYTNYRHERQNNESLSGNSVHVIYEDSHSRIWVGTEKGLNLLNTEGNGFRRFTTRSRNGGTISSDHITAILEDKNGRIWVGTEGGGVNLLNGNKGTFTHFDTDNGLPSNIITGVLQDDWGHIWLNTSKGLSRYNTGANKFRHFDKRHGVLGTTFSSHATIKSHRGELIIGSTFGVSTFDPMTVEDNLMLPKVVLTDFTLANESAEIGGEGSVLEKVISETSSISLTPEQASFGFSFSVLNYRNPEDNHYSYMLEGFDSDWSSVSRNSTAKYVNLAPGNYTFRVYGYNNEGVKSAKSADISIVIAPVLWQGWQSYIPYGILALVLISAVIIGWSLYKRVSGKVSQYQQMLSSATVKGRKTAQKNASAMDKPLAASITTAKPAKFKKAEKAEKVPVNNKLGLVPKETEVPVATAQPKKLHKEKMKIESPVVEKSYPVKKDEKPLGVYHVVSAVLTRSKTLVGKKELEVENHVAKNFKADGVNEGRLKNALFNLVSNSVRISERGKICISAEKKGSYILFKVTNSDIGFSKNKFNTLFKSSQDEDKTGATFVFTLPFPLDNEKSQASGDATSELSDQELKDGIAKKLKENYKVKPSNKKNNTTSSKAKVAAKKSASERDGIPNLKPLRKPKKDTIKKAVKAVKSVTKTVSDSVVDSSEIVTLNKMVETVAKKAKSPIKAKKPVQDIAPVSEKKRRAKSIIIESSDAVEVRKPASQKATNKPAKLVNKAAENQKVNEARKAKGNRKAKAKKPPVVKEVTNLTYRAYDDEVNKKNEFLRKAALKLGDLDEKIEIVEDDTHFVVDNNHNTLERDYRIADDEPHEMDDLIFDEELLVNDRDEAPVNEEPEVKRPVLRDVQKSSKNETRDFVSRVLGDDKPKVSQEEPEYVEENVDQAQFISEPLVHSSETVVSVDDIEITIIPAKESSELVNDIADEDTASHKELEAVVEEQVDEVAISDSAVTNAHQQEHGVSDASASEDEEPIKESIATESLVTKNITTDTLVLEPSVEKTPDEKAIESAFDGTIDDAISGSLESAEDAENHFMLVKADEIQAIVATYHVLIVDENPVKRMILQNYLSAESYRVSQVDSGVDAMTLIEKAGSIDLVLLGTTVAGISGEQVCEQIRESHGSQDLPVIFITDTTSEVNVDQYYKVGANDVLTKDDSKECFLKRVKKQINILEYHRTQEMAKQIEEDSVASINKVS